jgi:hypothetical protein
MPSVPAILQIRGYLQEAAKLKPDPGHFASSRCRRATIAVPIH